MSAQTGKLQKLGTSRIARTLRRMQFHLRSRKRHESPILRAVNLTRQTELAVRLELADTSEGRRRGLLGRESLPLGHGLWITPCEAVHTIGMRFPLDLVYLDRRRRVKKIRTNVPPRRLSACLLAHSVLELPAGTVERTRTAVGDILELSS